MRHLYKFLLILAATIIGTVIGGRVQAAHFRQPRNRVYQVTYIDASGNPIVDDQATATERQAPQRLHRYLTNRRTLDRAASQHGFVAQPGQRVRIQNRLITKATTGRVQSGSAGEFTIALPSKAKYQTIQFKPAAAKYQFQK